MIRLVLMLACLAVGFGGGVYWGVRNPEKAQKLATEEQRRFVEAQKQLLEKVKRKLDQLATAQPAGGATGSTGTTGAAGATPAGRTGFLGATQTGAARPDPELDELKRESEKQLQEADKLLQGQ